MTENGDVKEAVSKRFETRAGRLLGIEQMGKTCLKALVQGSIREGSTKTERRGGRLRFFQLGRAVFLQYTPQNP